MHLMAFRTLSVITICQFDTEQKVNKEGCVLTNNLVAILILISKTEMRTFYFKLNLV